MNSFLNKKLREHVYSFVVNEMYSYICLGVFPILLHFERKYTTTVGSIIHTIKNFKLPQAV